MADSIYPSIYIDNKVIESSESIQYLGITIYRNLTLKEQIKRVYKISNYNFISIDRIRKCLNILSISNMSKNRILSLIHHALVYRSPYYILDSISLYSPTISLSGKRLLDLNSCRLIRTNKCAFSMSATVLWNTLPEKLRKIETSRYKKILKKYSLL